ncbi:hypothetical protein LguiB_030425 [Lonicera macranthoides]
MALSEKTKTKTKTNSIAANPTSLPLAPHPPYLKMITEAISLRDRTGSSQPAIVKFIEDKYNKQLPPNFRKILSVQLKKFVKSEKLFKVKNSYKVSSDFSTTELTTKTKKVPKKPKEVANNAVEKRVLKTKRLSQVKTPEVLKKSNLSSIGSKAGKMKKLDEVKTPPPPQGAATKMLRSSTTAKKGKN